MVQQPVALGLTAAFLLVLSLTPLPKTPLILLLVSCLAIAHLLTQQKQLAVAEAVAAKAKPTTDRIEQHLSPDQMELNVGYGLIRLVDRKQGGDLLDRITNMRRQVAQELGIVVPPIRIRDGATATRRRIFSPNAEASAAHAEPAGRQSESSPIIHHRDTFVRLRTSPPFT